MKGRTQKEISKYANVHLGTIETYINKYKLQGLKKFNVSSMRKHSPDTAYFLGLYLTDGYFSNSTNRIEITLKSVDRAILFYYRDKYGFTTNYFKDTVRLTMTVSQTQKFAEMFNLTSGPKTFNAIVPSIPRILHKYVIRGMMDGDGTIRPRANDFRFYSESSGLASFYEEFMKHHNFNFSYQENGKIIYSSDFKALLYIYEGKEELALKRKRKLVEKKVRDIVRTYRMINCKM